MELRVRRKGHQRSGVVREPALAFRVEVHLDARRGSVNIEVDMIARYLERLLAGRGADDSGTLTFERLAELGYKRR